MGEMLGFANHAGNLVTSRLGDLCERVTRKNSENQSDLPLTISSIDGLVDQRDYFNKVVAAKDMSGYYLLKHGEFAYNKSYSAGYDYGSIKRLNRYEEGCLSTLYICFAIKSDTIDPDYLECFFDSLVWYADMPNICAEGARNHGLLNVDTEAFFNLSITYPVDIDEQRKIAKILYSMDSKIESEKTEVEKLKALKLSMLTKMFPKEGKKVPEIRFDGFTEDWEQRKVEEIAPLQRGFDLPTSDMKNGNYPVVMSNGIGGYHSEPKAKGPGVVTGRSGTIGKLHYIEHDYWPHNTTLWVTSFKGNDSKFVYYLYQRLDLSRFGSGSGVPTLNRNDVHDALVMIPSVKEQKDISGYLTNLDNLITLHQRKYEKIVDVKKALLVKLIGGEE